MMRRTRGWWLLAIVAMAGAWAIGPLGRLMRPGLREALPPLAGGWTPTAPIRAALVVQRADCSGNLRIVEPLHRVGVRERIALSVVWYTGAVPDSTPIRSALPAWLRHTPLRPIPRGVQRDLAQLGYRETPVLVAFDPEGRVRFATRAPRTSREYAGLRQIVEGLTFIEEL